MEKSGHVLARGERRVELAERHVRGDFEGARLLDIAPTLLDLAGYEVPESMQGRSLVAGMEKKPSGSGSNPGDEQIVRDRLAGLGYV